MPQNGQPKSLDTMTVAEIRSKAIDTVQKEARQASAITLIKTARSQHLSGKDCEINGNLKGALSSFVKAAALTKAALESSEFANERGKGVVRKEITGFLEASLPELWISSTQS